MIPIPSSERMPILALRGLVVFPGMTLHFDVGREKSIRAVEKAMAGKQQIFLVAQKDIRVDDPKEEDLFEIGTVATVKQILRMPSDSIRILVSRSSTAAWRRSGTSNTTPSAPGWRR